MFITILIFYDFLGFYGKERSFSFYIQLKAVVETRCEYNQSFHKKLGSEITYFSFSLHDVLCLQSDSQKVQFPGCQFQNTLLRTASADSRKF